MDLLTDPWISVRDTSGFRQIRYQDLLCGDLNMEISLPRDDMELACLQLLVCLTQVIFMPPDIKTLRTCIQKPLTVSEFEAGTEKYRDWFDLNHPNTPFMQIKVTESKEATPIQKLFVGLPAGNNHAFFNETEEVRNVCGGCAAIALFNQNSNSPNISGKHKGGLRGAAPMMTLIMGNSLRETVWRNVLTRDYLKKLFPNYEKQKEDDKPTWVEPIHPNKTIQENQIGLLRGLFWLPIHIRLDCFEYECVCDSCGNQTRQVYRDFKLGSDFKFTVSGQWPHPHSPRKWNIKKEQQIKKYLSFTTTAPAWTQLSECLIRHEQEGKEGQIPAAVVSQFPEVFPGAPLHLIVGGYRNKQASILQRRHELFSIAQGWENNLENLRELIEAALNAKNLLRSKLYYAVKGNKDRGLKGIGVEIHETAEDLYYQSTESLLHETLRSMNFREFMATRACITDRLSEISMEVFEQVTKPYTHKPELIPIIAISRRNFQEALNKMKKGATQYVQ